MSDKPWPVTATITIVFHGPDKPARVLIYGESGAGLRDFYMPRERAVIIGSLILDVEKSLHK